jgi:hypothetical protein
MGRRHSPAVPARTGLCGGCPGICGPFPTVPTGSADFLLTPGAAPAAGRAPGAEGGPVCGGSDGQLGKSTRASAGGRALLRRLSLTAPCDPFGSEAWCTPGARRRLRQAAWNELACRPLPAAWCSPWRLGVSAVAPSAPRVALPSGTHPARRPGPRRRVVRAMTMKRCYNFDP